MSEQVFLSHSEIENDPLQIIASLQHEISRLRKLMTEKISLDYKNRGDESDDVKLKTNDYCKKLAKIYKFRRRREAIFPCREIFSEPGWDILIDLILQESTGKKISISSACLASSAPATTALRWLAALEQNGLVEKEQDSSDGRRQFVRPTHKSRTLMQKLLDEFPD